MSVKVVLNNNKKTKTMKTDKTKKILVVLVGILLGGIVFSVIQFIEASPDAPNPGHSASEIGSGTFSGTASDVWFFPGNVDMTKHEIENMRIDNRTSDPTSPAVGQIWLRTDL